MKRLSKLAALLTAAGMTVCGFAATASAEDAPDGYVTVTAEKFTIGQGYISAPKKVPFYEGETGLDIIKKAVGEDKVIVTESSYGDYISGFYDDDSGSVVLADCIAEKVTADSLTGRASEGALSEFDYSPTSGFMFILNNESAPVGISSYEPTDGDVVRIQFSIYGYGSDIGTDNSSWGGEPSLIPETDRDELTKLIAEALEADIDCEAEVAVISDLDSTQSDLDEAVKSLSEKLSPPEKEPEKEPEQEPEQEPEPEKEPETLPEKEPEQEPEKEPVSEEKPVSTGAAAAGLFIPALILAAGTAFRKTK